MNEEVLMNIKESVETYREIFDIEETMIHVEKEDIFRIIEIVLKINPSSFAFSSGSKREGYFMESESKGLFFDKTSLVSQLNERPDFLLVMRIS